MHLFFCICVKRTIQGAIPDIVYDDPKDDSLAVRDEKAREKR